MIPIGAIRDHIRARVAGARVHAYKVVGVASGAVASGYGTVHAGALDNLTSLIQDMQPLIDAVVGLIPSIVTLIAYLAVGAFIVGLFAAILSKIRVGGGRM